MARVVRVSCVQLPAVLKGRSGAEKSRDNMRAIRRLLRVAGERRSDLVLLGEYANLWHRSASSVKKEFIADPIPGRFTREVASLARKYKMNVALPMFGTAGAVKGSYVVLIDRRGAIRGLYLKSHPTEPEQAMGMKAGSELPVFALDCANVGIMTCMDIEYPEVAQVLMLRGAEILLFPHVQGGWGEPDWEVRYRARAIDTGLYLVSACYGHDDGEWSPGKMLGRSGIVGRDGLIQADIGRGVGVITRDIDLDEERITQFYFFKKMPRTKAVRASRRPEIYGPIADKTFKKD